MVRYRTFQLRLQAEASRAKSEAHARVEKVLLDRRELVEKAHGYEAALEWWKVECARLTEHFTGRRRVWICAAISALTRVFDWENATLLRICVDVWADMAKAAAAARLQGARLRARSRAWAQR